MEYPEEIYHVFSDDMSGSGRRHAYNIGCARGYQVGYEAGKAERPDPLTGYSNLTVAIKDNEPIDWEKLDGLKVQCVHPELGTTHETLRRDKRCAPDSFYGWWDGETDCVYVRALCPAWDGQNGWTLWIEGEVPLRHKTADQLELYTYFLGQVKGDSPYLAYVGSPLATNTKSTIFYAPEMLKSITPAADWEVIEEYGPFYKPDVK